jgi:hypothetical protein
MEIGFGRHRGMPVERLVVTQADYVDWMLGVQDPSPSLKDARDEVIPLLRRFDRIPFQVQCEGCECTQAATRCAVYVGTASPSFWCGACNPYQQGASRGKLRIVRTYAEALVYVRCECGNKRQPKRDLVRALATGKGLGKPATAAVLSRFFAQPLAQSRQHGITSSRPPFINVPSSSASP